MVKKVIFSIVFLGLILTVISQGLPDNARVFLLREGDCEPDSLHELLIYVIPSRVAYDWSSPRSLHRSYVKNIKRSLLSKQNYLLGHAFVEFRSPLLPGRLLTGMRSASKKESRDYVLKDHYGLAILGAGLDGRLETGSELLEVRKDFARRDRLAFIRLLVSEEAAARLLAFFESYISRYESPAEGGVPYGGAFWPRYEDEGAGCSAFAVSFLDVAGLLRDFFDEWVIRINIPMSLIGGPYNDGNEVKIKDVRKGKKWADPDSLAPGEYVRFEIYDPSVMYQWIMDVRQGRVREDGFEAADNYEPEAPGLFFDARNVPVPMGEPLTGTREDPSIFTGNGRSPE